MTPVPEIVSVVIPVFGREEVFANVKRLLAQPYANRLKLVVVDNGNPPELSAKLKALGERGVEVVSLPENRGGSGAYIAGVEYAMRNHPATDLIWLLDDDAEPEERTLPELVETWSARGGSASRVGAVVSTILSRQRPGTVVETGADVRPGFPVQRRNNGLDVRELPEESFEVTYGAATSLLVSKDCIRACGFFENVFIHFDDIEWGYRVTQKCGWKIFAASRSRVVHPEFTGVSKSGAWLSYYDTRNTLWFCGKYDKKRLRVLLHRLAVHRVLLFLHGDTVLRPYLALALRDFRSGRLRLRGELPRLSLPADIDAAALDSKGGTVALLCWGRRAEMAVRSRLPNCRVRALVYDEAPGRGFAAVCRKFFFRHLALQFFVWTHPWVPVLYDYAFVRHRMLPLVFAKKIPVDLETLASDCPPSAEMLASFPWDVCMEQDAVRARLRANPAAWAAGKERYLEERFKAYESRLAQLTGPERKAFRLRFGRELRWSLRLGVLDLKLFSASDRRRIRSHVRFSEGIPVRLGNMVLRLLPGALRRGLFAVASRIWIPARSAVRRMRG